MISVDHLREFSLIAKLGSMSQAAHELHVSQPTLSKHINRLETDLGTHLFVRNVNGLTLTDLGVRVLQHTQQINDAVERIEQLAAQAWDAIPLRVFGLESFPCAYKVFSENNMHDAMPDLAVALTLIPDQQLATPTLQQALEHNNFDIMYIASCDPRIAAMPDGCSVSPGWTQHLVAIVEQSHPLAGRQSITAHELQGATLARTVSNVNRSQILWSCIEALLAQAAIEYQVRTIPLFVESDYYADMTDAIWVIPAKSKPHVLMEAAGKRAVPIADLTLNMVALHCEDSDICRHVAVSAHPLLDAAGM